MSNIVTSCQLVCLQKNHDAIDLPDGETVVIGRSPQTQITDPLCSRSQLELTADWQHQNVSVRQKGLNSAAIDGTNIDSNSVATLTGESTLFILSGMYPHKVVFTLNRDSGIDKKPDHKKVNKCDEQKVENKKKFTSQSANSTKVINSDKSGAKLERSHSKDRETNKTNSNVNSPTKQSKTNSSSKRHSNNLDKKQPLQKKLKLENKSDLGDNRNGQHKSSSSSTKQSGPGTDISLITKDIKRESLSKSKCIDIAHRNNRDGSGPMELDEDDDKHLTSVQEKLKKMKQDAAIEVKINTKEKASGSFASPQTSSSSVKRPSDNVSKKAATISCVPSDKAVWDYNVDHYVFTSRGVVACRKIAGFDLDGTIIGTRSGKAFPEDADDWKIFMPEIFHKLKDLHAKNFKIVFFTNQLGVARGKTKIEDLMRKIENVLAKLQVPVQVFIATHEGRYRKPMTGMWEKLEKHFNGGVSIDLKSSFYVGDAAGRQANWAPKKKKDFSCSDRLFALNVGVDFKTPEEFFQNQKPTTLFKMPDFDPRKLDSDAKLLNGDSKLTSSSKEAIVLVGFPASGKSHFAINVLGPKGYKVISRDTLGTWQKCVKHAQEGLVNSSVVIDNTNLTKEERARYTECAKKAHVPCRCFVFTTTVDHCRHNERFRQMITKSHAKINEMIFNQIKKKYEEPSMTEGFTEIVNVNFVPRFSSKEEELDYRKFLLEK